MCACVRVCVCVRVPVCLVRACVRACTCAWCVPACVHEWQDKERAFELYSSAGEAGSVEAWHNVAAMQSAGDGVVQNEAAGKYIMDVIIPKLKADAAAE